MYDELPEIARRTVAAGFCPDCGHRGFVLGPKGGHSLNVECGNLDCRARFNVARAFVSGELVFAHGG